MRKRCAYCNKPSLDEVCSESCRIEYDNFKAFHEKWYKKSVIILLLTLLLFVPSLFYPEAGLFIIGVMMFLMGVELFFFPFTTPESLRDMGAKRATESGIKISKCFMATGPMLMILNIIIFFVYYW